MKQWTARELTRIADALLAKCIKSGDRPKVVDLARAVGLPVYRFSKLFLRVVGVRPSEYLKRGQIDRGKHLLLSTEWSIEAIAEACCFRDPATFYRAFRRIVGMTPKQFRDRHEP